ncbi:MAG: amino acid adenylation domain-containing protein, partial [Verrucomicrobia bacterium]|nr:amino acid adenylation domain-containing protein [Verrucomicrobiota bacterium]
MEKSLPTSVHQYVARNAVRSPEAVAVEFEERRLTYHQLNAQANRFARALLSLGVAPGTLIGLSLPRSLDSLVAIYGALKAGCALAPLDPHYPADRLALMADTARISTLLTESALLPVFSKLPRVALLTLEAILERLPCLDASDPEIPVREDDLLYVIFTSGSTGRPKSVAMPHRPLIHLAEWQAGLQSELPPRARTLQFTTLSFDVAFQEIFSTARDAGTLVLMREELRYDPLQLLAYLRQQRIHRLFLPFVALNQLAEAVESQHALPSDLRQVITAGEALQATPRIRALFKALPSARLHNHYGPSETHVATAFALDPDPDLWAPLPSIGFPIASARVELLDDQGNPTPPGEAGEMFIGGECLSQGYLHRDDLTRERFPWLPLGAGEGHDERVRVYRTGDLARWNPDGSLEFLGRKDHQVKIRGHRVELGEVESILAGHPAVKECAVGVVGEGANRLLAAYVVWRSRSESATEDLRRLLRGALPEYAVPSWFTTLDALPLTPSGKLDRRALPTPEPERLRPPEAAEDTPPGHADLGGAPRSPINDYESMVAEVW